MTTQDRGGAGKVKPWQTREWEIVLRSRGSERLVPRLRRAVPLLSGPIKMHMSERGAISNLSVRGQSTVDHASTGSTAPLVTIQQLQHHALAVRVRVHAVGLNFRDVLNVLGMYPGDRGAPGDMNQWRRIVHVLLESAEQR